MSKTHGTFVWYDVMTNDTKAANSFYSSVIGWDAKDSGMTDRSYTLLSMGPTVVGGLMPIPEDAAKAGVRPAWMGYIGVDDVDVYAKRVTPATPGHVGWRELHAGEHEGAFAFYSGLFGWAKAEAVDMGPAGVYQTFAIHGTQAGGMMTKTPQTPAPFWLYYFNVEAVDSAMARVKEGGGQILNGPLQVPGGSWIVQCSDPQGAMFAMTGPRR